MTGSTGVVGPVLVARLLAAGYRVRVLARRAVSTGVFAENVDIVLGDMTDRDAIQRAVAGTDLVFHLAAKLHSNNPAPGARRAYERINVTGTRFIADAAVEAGVKRVVFFSTISVYGDSHGSELLDEASPVRPASLYATTKREAENIVLSISSSADNAPAGVVLRLAAIYGSRMKGNYYQLARWLKHGVFVPVGPGQNRRTLVYDADAADAAIVAAQHRLAAGEIFNVTDGAVHSFHEILGAISEAIGRRPPKWYVPVTLARTAGRGFDIFMKAAGRSGRILPLLDKMTEDVAVSGDKIQATLGFRPRFDLRAGWRETVLRMSPANASGSHKTAWP